MTALELADKLIASPCEYAEIAAAELRRRGEFAVDAARYRWIAAGVVYIEPNNQEGKDFEIYVGLNAKGIYCRTVDQFDAAIDAAIQEAMGEAK